MLFVVHETKQPVVNPSYHSQDERKIVAALKLSCILKNLFKVRKICQTKQNFHFLLLTAKPCNEALSCLFNKFVKENVCKTA
jgi:hypothetical protein